MADLGRHLNAIYTTEGRGGEGGEGGEGRGEGRGGEGRGGRGGEGRDDLYTYCNRYVH